MSTDMAAAILAEILCSSKRNNKCRKVKNQHRNDFIVSPKSFFDMKQIEVHDKWINTFLLIYNCVVDRG